MQHDGPRSEVRDQEPLALERFMKAFESELDYLFASLRRLGVRPEEADDLAHEVFLALLRTTPELDQRRALQLRLFGLAVRVVLKHRRRSANGRRQSMAPLSLSLAVLDRLPLKHRSVLVMHELDQVPLAEIAASLSMTRVGAAVRLRKARREMEVALRELADDWQAGRFGHPGLLLTALGVRNDAFANRGGRPAARADDVPVESAGDSRPMSDAIRAADEIHQLRDDIFLLEMVMDELPEVIYFKDRESRFTHINRFAATHYGIVSPALAVGRTDFDFFTGEHASQALRDEQKIIQTGEPLVSVEERETLPDGKLRSVWTTKLPLHDREGEIVGTFGLSRHIGDPGAA